MPNKVIGHHSFLAFLLVQVHISSSFFQLIFIKVWLLCNIVILSKYRKMNQPCIYTYIYTCIPSFWTFSHPRHHSALSSLCCAVRSHWLSGLCIVSVLYICQSQSLNFTHHLLSPLVSIHLFSTTESLFLLCIYCCCC